MAFPPLPTAVDDWESGDLPLINRTKTGNGDRQPQIIAHVISAVLDT